MMILFLTLAFLLFPLPAEAATRLGLHVTQEELNCWRQRAGLQAQGSNGITCPIKYNSAGDVSTNSPGDWTRITNNRNSFASNPSNGRWTAPVASGAGGCVIAEAATYSWPEPGDGGTYWSARLRDAAFYALVTGSTTDRAAIKAELLWVSSQSFTQFGNPSGIWCFNVWVPRDSAPTFGITSILTKVLFAYDYLLASGASFSQAERDQLDRWFFDAAAYWSSDIDFGLNSVFADRWNGNYTLTGPCNSSSLAYLGSALIGDYGKFYNNRRGGIIRFSALAGIFLQQAGRSYSDGRGANNTVAKIVQSGKMYAQEFVRFSVYPGGFVGDFERASDGLEIGWGYGGPTVAQVVEIADAYARVGDTSIYTYNTALGACNSAGTINDGGSRVGQNRDILFMLQSYYKYPTDQYARYQNSNDSPTDNNRIDGRSPRTTGASWYGLHDTYMVMGNNYFQDSFIRQAYTHTHANSIAYPSSPTVSNPAWTGENGLWPGVLFMFGQMEGVVNPYALTGRTFWVSPTGNDGNTCTDSVTAIAGSGTRQTLQGGLGCGGGLVPGDTLYLRAGSYAGITRTQVPPSGSGWGAGQVITIASAPGETATLTVNANKDNVLEITGAVSYVSFDRFIMLASGTAQVMYIQGGGASGSGGSAHHIRFQNNDMSGAWHNCIQTDSNNLWFKSNTIHDCGRFNPTDPASVSSAKSHAFYSSDIASIYEDNEIYDVKAHSVGGYGYALQIYPTSTNVVIKNNRIHDSGGITFYGTGGEVFNNVLYANHGQDISITGSSSAFVNNTLSSATSWGIYNAGSNNIIRNNISVNHTAADINPVGSGATITHNLCTSGCAINANPRFVNAAAFNFQLCTGANLPSGGSPTCVTSQAINAGVALTLPTGITTDIAAVSRPQGGLWDIGAYESGAPTSATVSINLPVGCSGTSSACTITTPTVNLAGTATGASAISWTCPRCGTSGGATGLTSWTATVTGLKVGANDITVQADPGTTLAVIRVTYQPTHPGAALVAAYGFDTGSGTTAFDATTNGNNGTFVNAPTWTTAGKFGNAIQFNGTSDYISIPDATSLDFTQSFTFSAWVFPMGTAKTDFRAIMVKDYVQYLYSSSSGYCSGDGAILGGFTTNGGYVGIGQNFTVCRQTPLTLNQWTHVAITYNGTALILYLDGVAIPVPLGTVAATGLMEPSTGLLRLAWSGVGAEFFEGRLDEVRVYNVAIPASNATNSTPGAACGYTTQGDRTTMALVSVVGDMNCSVVAGSPPITIKFPASATGLKVGAAGTLKFGQP